MPPSYTTEGLDAAKRIREELPETALVVLSAHVEVEEATELLASGQRTGYLLKSRVTDVADFIDTTATLTGDRITGTTVAPVKEIDCCGVTATAIVR